MKIVKPLKVDKTTSARKMFNDATLLYYERRSPISVHHLAHAAHEVLHALTKDSHMLNTAYLTPGGLKEFKKQFTSSKNFIKHADRDPNATLTFNPEFNVCLLFDCAYIIVLNIDKNCVYSQTVICWCAFTYPELFAPEFIESVNKSIKVSFDLYDFEHIADDLRAHYHDYSGITSES